MKRKYSVDATPSARTPQRANLDARNLSPHAARYLQSIRPSFRTLAPYQEALPQPQSQLLRSPSQVHGLDNSPAQLSLKLSSQSALHHDKNTAFQSGTTNQHASEARLFHSNINSNPTLHIKSNSSIIEKRQPLSRHDAAWFHFPAFASPKNSLRVSRSPVQLHDPLPRASSNILPPHHLQDSRQQLLSAPMIDDGDAQRVLKETLIKIKD